MKISCLVLMIGFAALTWGQPPNIQAQREAMKKLDFLVGRWLGDASVRRDAGQPIKLTQTEDVQLKMDGLVMLIEGTGRNANGEVAFQAFATISYDDAASVYHFRAYNDGRYLDTQLNVTPNGFVWSFPAGPAKISNTMRLNENGEWQETTQMVFGTSDPRPLVDMLLRRDTSGVQSVSLGMPGRFDGKWLTTVSCDAARDAMGYSFRFVSEIKDGNLRGQHGKQGEPSSLRIEGKINAEGTGKLYATGHTGSKEFVPGRDTPRGTEYSYDIEAHFAGDNTGTGTRIEGRPCTLRFEKQ
jgi:hypothetical protein